ITICSAREDNGEDNSLYRSLTYFLRGLGYHRTSRLYWRIGDSFGAMIMVFLHSRITEPNMLLWVRAIMGLFVNGTDGAVFALMSEAYPTVARATAQNVLWNFARAVGALGPLTVSIITAKHSYQAAISLLASIYQVGTKPHRIVSSFAFFGDARYGLAADERDWCNVV